MQKIKGNKGFLTKNKRSKKERWGDFKMENKNLKIINNFGEDGITLIALVITIIVLLLLAGVSISMLTGDNGILQQATSAKEKTEQSSDEEQLNLAVIGAIAKSSSYIVEYDLLDEELENYFGSSNYTLTGDSSSRYIVTINSIKYNVSTTGQVTEPISATTSYVGCYADVDADGTVDGIIYVDLLANEETSGLWGSDSDYYVKAIWEITTISESDVQNYYVKSTYSTDEFGEANVIVPVSTASTKSERFYVMSLENFTDNSSSTYFWYNNMNVYYSRR